MRGLVALLVLLVGATATVHAQTPPGPAPVQLAGRVLTLNEAVAIALERQPQILARVGELDAAQARVVQALAPLLPQMTFSYNQRRSQTFSSVLGPDLATTYVAQQTATLKVYDFGKTYAAVDAARFNTQVSKEALEQTRDQIVLGVKQGYFTLLLSQRLVGVNQQALERAELNLRSARGFYEVGTRPKLDVTRAEVDVANARVNLIRANNAVNLARVSLSTAMGLPPDQTIQIEDILGYERMAVSPADLAAEALRARPEVRQATARVQSAEATARQMVRQFLPDLNANGTVGYAGNEYPLSQVWELGFTLSWTWFEGFGNVGRLREARANLEAAKSNAASVELSVRQEVEQSYLALVEAEERARAAEKAVEAAQENFRLAQGRFDAGVGTIIELTDAQLAFTQAQSTEIQALADLRIGRAQLERALGRR
ncbi:MAG: TolC family protein [Candidatus Rokubacteria bacterium]|nr:TolC family protein [Candidatus Rokubacteria bacterium]